MTSERRNRAGEFDSPPVHARDRFDQQGDLMLIKLQPEPFNTAMGDVEVLG